MKNNIAVLMIGLGALVSNTSAQAGCVPDGFREMIFGPSIGIGVTAGDQKQAVNTRINANMAILFANIGVDVSTEDNSGLYLAGVGLGHFATLQYGQGNDEHVMRLRAEIPLNDLISKYKKPAHTYPAATFTLDKINGSDESKGSYRVGLGLSMWL